MSKLPSEATPGQLTADALADAIEAVCVGRVEWRVRNPVDRSYCISFDRSTSTRPKGEAEAWLADHRRRFPESQFAEYEVAEVRVFSGAEELALEAAKRLRAASADSARLVAAERDRCYELTMAQPLRTETPGEDGELGYWSDICKAMAFDLSSRIRSPEWYGPDGQWIGSAKTEGGPHAL